jgi:oxygen-dependent protoporphyrinogen oxidase
VPSTSSQSIAILGAGVTGLTAAYRLMQRGFTVRVFAASDRVGGAIRTDISGEWLSEAGPNTLLGHAPATNVLIDELGLSAERTPAQPAAKNRYIVRRGVPVALPRSPGTLLISPLFSLGAKLRLLAEWRHRPLVRAADLSLQSFIHSHFGQEFVDYALNPFVTGIYAGDPAKLSAQYAFPQLWAMERTHGSLLRGQLVAARMTPRPKPRGIFSFRRGLQTLPDTLAARLPAGSLALGCRVEHLQPGPPWRISWIEGGSPHSAPFDQVIAALPAPALARLRFGPAATTPLASLDRIEHPPLTSLFLGFHRAQVAHPLDGFGLLVPAAEKRTILGVLFSSTLFPGRAPAHHVGLTVLIGGTRQPDLAQLSPEHTLAAITPDLQELLGVVGPPVFSRHTFWPQAIPQYNLGYADHLLTMQITEEAFPGFLIGGQARDGIALPACLAAGEALAARI